MGTIGGILLGFITGAILVGGVTKFTLDAKAATKDGALLFCKTTGQFFVIQNGSKRLVQGATSSNTDPLSSLGYLVSDAINLACNKISQIPSGPPITT